MLDRTEIISCHIVKVSSNYNQSYWKRSRKCHKESNSLVVILDDRFYKRKQHIFRIISEALLKSPLEWKYTMLKVKT